VVKPDVARQQIDAEAARAEAATAPGGGTVTTPTLPAGSEIGPPTPAPPTRRRFHGSVTLDPTRVGRDAGRVAEEVIAHLAGLPGAQVQVTLEVEASLPEGAPENVVRTVTENSRTLKFTTQGFEEE